MQTLAQRAHRLASGSTTARALAEEAIEAAQNVNGEGARVFVALNAEKVRAQADAHDRLARFGMIQSPLAGLTVSVKDLFDVCGEVTSAGSKVLAEAPPALADAPVIAHLRGAGAILCGRTNMTEFAYSGVGINPHFGTPACPWDRTTRRIPGGSSSGAAVSVTDGMAAIALGTDTGGSCRVPAALCGTVGFKPTQARISRAGATPLSQSLDSIGSLGASVACVATVDHVMSGAWSFESLRAIMAAQRAADDVRGRRFGLPTTLVFDAIEDSVAQAFERALTRLSDAGAIIERIELPVLAHMKDLGANGGIAAAEAASWHKDLLARRGADYDQRVRQRIEGGFNQSAADYIATCALRRRLTGEFDQATRAFDAVIMPTTPIVAPAIAAFAHDEDYWRLNGLLLRNTSIANLMDRCAISLPCHDHGDPPVGLMLVGDHGGDGALLRLAGCVETVLGSRTGV